MVAPNGARRTKNDHPRLPVTIDEIVTCAAQCHTAGAGAIHAHMRDENRVHVLDAGLYRELVGEMSLRVPGMDVQITTEAAGRYSPEDQRKLVREVMPAAVSVSLSEMFSDGDRTAAIDFYQWALAAGISVQHIVYDVAEFSEFIELASRAEIPPGRHQLLFVLGRYAPGQNSDPADLDAFLDAIDSRAATLDLDWAACAFGIRQQMCLVEAMRRGGKARVGFENGFRLRNGLVARDNADLVDDLVKRTALEVDR